MSDTERLAHLPLIGKGKARNLYKRTGIDAVYDLNEENISTLFAFLSNVLTTRSYPALVERMGSITVTLDKEHSPHYQIVSYQVLRQLLTAKECRLHASTVKDFGDMRNLGGQSVVDLSLLTAAAIITEKEALIPELTHSGFDLVELSATKKMRQFIELAYDYIEGAHGDLPFSWFCSINGLTEEVLAAS